MPGYSLDKKAGFQTAAIGVNSTWTIFTRTCATSIPTRSLSAQHGLGSMTHLQLGDSIVTCRAAAARPSKTLFTLTLVTLTMIIRFPSLCLKLGTTTRQARRSNG